MKTLASRYESFITRFAKLLNRNPGTLFGFSLLIGIIARLSVLVIAPAPELGTAWTIAQAVWGNLPLLITGIATATVILAIVFLAEQRNHQLNDSWWVIIEPSLMAAGGVVGFMYGQVIWLLLQLVAILAPALILVLLGQTLRYWIFKPNPNETNASATPTQPD